MIPHHSAAILMCEEAPITDPDVKVLCKAIKSSQSEQIDQMKGILAKINSE